MSNNPALNVIPVPAFHDNYIWLFHFDNDANAYVVDPGDANVVEAALTQNELQLSGILITHHHPDHTGGIDQLLSKHSVPVYGPAGGSVPQVTVPMKDQTFKLDNGLIFSTMTVPGHTLDHIAYFSEPAGEDPLLFCGDTLFAGGCGRLFEGSPQQMHHSLSRLTQLPSNTRVYCAHEYTLSNLAFAKAVEPKNTQLLERIQTEKARRQQNIPTIPTTIGLELSTNPFVRSDQDAVIRAAEAHCQHALAEEHEVLATVRQWKDSF